MESLSKNHWNSQCIMTPLESSSFSIYFISSKGVFRHYLCQYDTCHMTHLRCDIESWHAYMETQIWHPNIFAVYNRSILNKYSPLETIAVLMANSMPYGLLFLSVLLAQLDNNGCKMKLTVGIDYRLPVGIHRCHKLGNPSLQKLNVYWCQLYTTEKVLTLFREKKSHAHTHLHIYVKQFQKMWAKIAIKIHIPHITWLFS